MSLFQNLKEAALMSDNVKAELGERKYYFKLSQYIAAIAGVIFGIGSYFALNELLPQDFSSHIFGFIALVTVFYFVTKFTQIITGFIIWIICKMFNYYLPVAQIIKSINFAFLPLWPAAFLVPFLIVAPNPISGTTLYVAYIFLAIFVLWAVRSLVQIMHAILFCTIHEARAITGVSFAFLLTIILIIV